MIRFMIIVLLTFRCFAVDLNDMVEDYVEESEENLFHLYADMTADAKNIFSLIKEGDGVEAVNQARALAGERETDPFLHYALAHCVTCKQPKVNLWNDWKTVLEKSGSGSEKKPYKTYSLRMTMAWLQDQKADVLYYAIYPDWGRHSIDPEKPDKVKRLLMWVVFIDPDLKERMVVYFELGQAFAEIYAESGVKSTGGEVARLYWTCVEKAFNPCVDGYIRALQINRYTGIAMTKYWEQAEHSAYAMVQLGDNLSGKHSAKQQLNLAEKYWLLAAGKKEQMAYFRLGRLYGGYIGDQDRYMDIKKAQHYFELAQDSGFAHAGWYLVDLAKTHSELKIDEETKYRYLKRSAEGQDDPDARAMLDFADYLYQRNQEKDRKLACAWIKKAEEVDKKISGSFALHRYCERSQSTSN